MHILIEILFQRQCPEANRKNLYCNYSFSLFCVFHVFWLFYFKAYINIEFGVRRCVKHFSRRHSSNNTMSLVLVIAGDPKISFMIKKVYVELLWKNCNGEQLKDSYLPKTYEILRYQLFSIPLLHFLHYYCNK